MASYRLSMQKAALGGALAAVLCVAPEASAMLPAPQQQGAQNSNGQQQPCPPQQGKSGAANKSNGNSGSAGNGAGNGKGGPNSAPCNNNKPAPLFGGALTLKKSHQSTDSTALGFNGVDPNGQVQQAFLNASPSSTAEQKAQAMAGYRPSPAALTAFQQQGGLTQNSTPPVPQ